MLLIKPTVFAAGIGLLVGLSACVVEPQSSSQGSQIQSAPSSSTSSTPKKNSVGQTVTDAPAKVVNGVDCSIIPRSSDELISYRKNCTDATASEES